MIYRIYKPSSNGFEYIGDYEVKRKRNEKVWMIPKSIKFDKKKLKEAKDRKRIKDLPEMCRRQLDILISD